MQTYNKLTMHECENARTEHNSNHSVNSSSHSVNGDITIQWACSNFDHS